MIDYTTGAMAESAKRYLKIACWVVGLGFVAVACGWATFDQWAGLARAMFGAA